MPDQAHVGLVSFSTKSTGGTHVPFTRGSYQGTPRLRKPARPMGKWAPDLGLWAKYTNRHHQGKAHRRCRGALVNAMPHFSSQK